MDHLEEAFYVANAGVRTCSLKLAFKETFYGKCNCSQKARLQMILF